MAARLRPGAPLRKRDETTRPAAVYCSVGDWMIAAAVAFGLAYTLFNVESRQSWAYRDAMPRLPFLGTGLTPILQ